MYFMGMDWKEPDRIDERIKERKLRKRNRVADKIGNTIDWVFFIFRDLFLSILR